MLGELNAIGSDAETSKRAHPAACGRGSQATLPFHHSEGVPKAKNDPQTSGASSAGSQSRHRLRSINPFWCTLSCGAFAIMCALSPMTSAVRCPSLAPCEFTVPLCWSHHRELHRHGDETAWWRKIGLDPTTRARTLWLQTHPLGASKLAVGAADCSWPSRPTPDTSLFDSLSAQVLHSGLAKGCLRC